MSKEPLFDLCMEAIVNEDIDSAMDILELSVSQQNKQKKNYTQGVIMGSMCTLAGVVVGLTITNLNNSK